MDRGTVAAGALWLDVRPATAEVYVDGYYVGTGGDLSAARPGLGLVADLHRVEVRAPGFLSAIFDVRIPAGETITYRTTLSEIQRPPAPVVVSSARAPAKTIYVVPGCYAGDIRPTPAHLRAGCDIATMRIIPPTATVAGTR